MSINYKSIWLFLFILLFFCGSLIVSPIIIRAESSLQEQQAELQRELQNIENQIAQYEQELKSVQGEKKTLQNKINQLKKQQASLSLRIKATTLQINNLTNQIADTENSITKNEDKIRQLKQEVGQLLQLIHEQDEKSWVYILMRDDNLSDVFGELENYSKVGEELSGLLDKIKQTNDQLNQEKQMLGEEKDDAKNLLSVQTLQKQDLLNSVGEQNNLLQETKGKESNYQNILSDKQKQAKEIRGRLYQLLGISAQITFGQAVEIATWAGAQTGVRPAFLLAILTQESNLGKNVGQCLLKNMQNGNGIRITTGALVSNVMKPSRDIQPFLVITSELGRDSQNTMVSCPMSYGYGGAMGPSQFIPSTWMGYRDRVSAITGKSADPWDIRDAFLATAIKSAKDGATKQSGEWAAAMIYFSGSTNKKYRFYGDSVVAQAAKYQQDIDELNN